jgi:hypothetical protein
VASADGIVCGDDLELQRFECASEPIAAAIRQDADFITDPGKSCAYHPGVTAAVAEALGRVPVWDGFWAVQQHGTKWVAPELSAAPNMVPSHIAEVSTAVIRVDVQRCGQYWVYDADDGAIALYDKLLPEDLLRIPRDVWQHAELAVARESADALRAYLATKAPAGTPPPEPVSSPAARLCQGW